jgi:hypothetical protein
VNENKLFRFCELCICFNKEMFKVDREVTGALNQCFILPSAPVIYHSWDPVSASLTLRDLANCVVLPTHIEIAPSPGIFI